jgi:hypothetical protein
MEFHVKKLISADKSAGKETWMNFDRDGQAEIIQKQHIKEVLEANKRQQNEWEYGKLIGNTQRHHQKVADIPNLLYVQLKEKFGHPADNPRDWAKWLNDPDNRHFRTGGGRI